MKLYARLAIAAGAIAIYLGALRYVTPPDQPYFVLGVGIVGLVSWLLGSLAGLGAMLALIPLTNLVYQQFTVSTSYASFSCSPAYIGLQVILCIAIGYLHRERKKQWMKEEQLKEANIQLQSVLSKVQELGGLHNLCSGCKQIQTDEGQWQPIDQYLSKYTKMEFSHGICTDCGAAFQRAAETLKD